jgi:hypothetical protein
MSVRQCQQAVDSAEFVGWQAYALLEPFGEERGDLRAGIVAATIANVNRGKNTRPYRPREFMPTFRPRPPEPEPVQTVEEQQRILSLLALASGGKIVTTEA